MFKPLITLMILTHTLFTYSWAEGICGDYLGYGTNRTKTLQLIDQVQSGSVTKAQDQFYRNGDGKLKVVEFNSFDSGKLIKISVDTILGVSSATVFRSSDLKYAVKVYDLENPDALYIYDYRYNYNEILITRFFKRFEIPVADVLDASDSILGFREPFVVVVKEYVSGLSYVDLMSRDDDDNAFRAKSKAEILADLVDLQKKAKLVFSEYYYSWYILQPEVKQNNRFLKPSIDFDNHDLNWVYSSQGWVLIDP